MSQLAKLNRSSLLVATKSLGKALSNAGLPTHKFLDFATNQAIFRYKEGDKETEVTIGTKMAVNWQEVSQGYICWKDSKPYDQIHWNMLAMPDMPPMEMLPDHGPYVNDDKQRDGWQRQMTIPMFNPVTKEDFLFKTGPDSSFRAASRFMDELKKELILRIDGLKTDDDELTVTPMVELGKTFFIPRGRTNKVFVPQLKLIDEWVDSSTIEFAKAPAATGKFTRDMLEESSEGLSNNRTIDADIKE